MVPGPVRSLPSKTLRVHPRRSKVTGVLYSSTRPSVNVIRKRVLLATRGVWHEGRPERCRHRRAVELQTGWSSDRAKRRDKFKVADTLPEAAAMRSFALGLPK